MKNITPTYFDTIVPSSGTQRNTNDTLCL